MKLLYLFGLLFLSLNIIWCNSIDEEDGKYGLVFKYNTNSGLPPEFETEVAKYFRTGIFTTKLQLQLKEFSEYFSVGEDVVSCSLCQVGAHILVSYVNHGLSQPYLRNLLIYLCILVAYPEDICEGLIDLNMPLVLYHFQLNQGITEKDMCQIVGLPLCAGLLAPVPWQIDLHEPHNTQIKELPTEQNTMSNADNTLTIVHIADIHIDPFYKEGTPVECSKIVCCRNYSKSSISSSKATAGYWGTLGHCDIPFRTLNNTLQNVKDKYDKIDMVYFTGDIIPHAVWETTYEGNIQNMEKVYTLFKDVFQNIPFYPILGNHEPQPLNQYMLDNITADTFTTQWLYNTVSNFWVDSFDEEALANIRKTGSYSVKIKSGLRVIGLNNNVCYSLNWWLIANTVNPNNLLQWLSDELYKAEKKHEYVHLLYHIPPGSSQCELIWQQQFRLIVKRFSHIIKGQFCGHTHSDELVVIYDPDDISIPVGGSFNGGSISTWTKINPNFRVFKADKTNFDLQDYEQWVFDVMKFTTEDSTPEWYKLYSFKDYYEVDNLSPQELNKAVLKIAKNESMLQDYLRFSVKDSEMFNPNDCSKKTCIEKALCRIVTSVYDDRRNCEWIKNITDINK